jgi:hypothetical protein
VSSEARLCEKVNDLLERMSNLIRSLTSPSVRIAAGVTLGITAMVVVASGGCSNGATPGPVPSTSRVSPTPTVTPSGATPTPTPTPPPQLFVSMTTAVGATTDPTYGVVSGYGLLGAAPTSSPATTPAPPQVITVPANHTIVFLNFDRSPHTASLLTAVGPTFPPTFNNNNGASGFTPEGSPITTAEFSTGAVGASAGLPVYSFIYNTGSLTGFFFFGDFYDYQANPPFRTVIIIQ